MPRLLSGGGARPSTYYELVQTRYAHESDSWDFADPDENARKRPLLNRILFADFCHRVAECFPDLRPNWSRCNRAITNWNRPSSASCEEIYGVTLTAMMPNLRCAIVFFPSRTHSVLLALV
jgi:hypothetical protein